MKALIPVLAASCILACSGGAGGGTNSERRGEPQMVMSLFPGTEPSEIAIQLTLSAPEELTVYSWRGAIYPMLGRGLAIESQGSDGRTYRAVSVEKVLPKFPHAADSVAARSYTYPKPLVVRLVDREGNEASGCVSLTASYDTTESVFSERGFSPILIRSNTYEFCIE